MAQDKKDGKLFLFNDDVQKQLKSGAKTVYDAVMMTYGPKGRNVIIEKTYGKPVITRDGVTVARESYIEDRAPNLSAQLLIEASQETNRIAGDGTSATVGLTYNLIKYGLQKIASGVNPMEVKKEILDDSYKLLDELEKLSKPIKQGQLEQVAAVSSGDEPLGQLIAEAVEKVGPDGGLLTEKAPVQGVERSYVNGYYLQKGFQAIAQGKKELSTPYVVISSKVVSSAADVITVIQKVGELAHQDQNLPPNQPLTQPLQIAFFGEFEGDAANVIIANIQKGVFDGSITNTPPAGEMGPMMLDDLAVYTGGKLIAAGDKLANVTTDYIGKADKIVVSATETTVFGGNGASEDVERRVKELKDRLATEEMDGVAEKLRDRLAKLENKIALFKIGGPTETAREELEFRIEDALQASRAAAQQGVVTGGGITLLKLSQTKGLSTVFPRALQSVFKRLMRNAALPAEVKLNQALDAPEGYGFNLRSNGELVDLVKAGILDPTLVVEQIIINSATTAANAVSLGTMITFIDKPDAVSAGSN